MGRRTPLQVGTDRVRNLLHFSMAEAVSVVSEKFVFKMGVWLTEAARYQP